MGLSQYTNSIHKVVCWDHNGKCIHMYMYHTVLSNRSWVHICKLHVHVAVAEFMQINYMYMYMCVIYTCTMNMCMHCYVYIYL